MKIKMIHLMLNNLKKSFRLLTLFSILFLGAPLFSSEIQNDKRFDSSSLKLGTPESFLEQVGVKEFVKTRSSFNSSSDIDQLRISRKVFKLVDNLGDEIDVQAKNFFVEVDGSISLDGHAVGKPNSEFILQGSGDKLYGWVILRDQDIAFEYTTQGEELVVKPIAITDVHPICNLESHKSFGVVEHSKVSVAQQLAGAPHIGPYPGTHVGKLESRPGSQYVIFLDTRNIMSDGVPYDVSKEFIWQTWQIVAASFSMLDVNVTTNKAVYDNASASKRGGGTMYRQTGRSSCHFAFGTSTFCTLYKETTAYGQGRTAAHEFGHLLHLAHDGGNPGGEYYEGIPAYQWVPIMGNYWMGNSWTNALYQWSKGEYSGSSNREDDFVKMQQFVPFKSDDNSGSKALNIASNGDVKVENNIGQIERNTDSDRFSFSIGSSGGHVNLTIDRIEHIGGGMLDVQAYIRNASGSIVAQSNKSVNRSASFNLDLSAGSYTLEIKGGAEGTPSNGFSNYSSIGYYGIEGSITGGGDGGESPSMTSPSNGSTLSGASQLFNWSAGSASQFEISAGSSQGAEDYYSSSSPFTGSSHTVTGLPTDGSTIYITLDYLMNGAWSQLHYSYTAFDDSNSGELGLTSPVEGETLSGSSQLFTWNPGDATGFWFYAGSSPGAQDYYRNSSQINGTSHTVTGLPTDGSTVHITFHYLRNGSWSNLKYTYTAADDGGSCTSPPATPNKPTNTANSSTSFTSSWGAVSNATGYTVQLWVNGAWKTMGSTADNQYLFSGLASGTTQYSRVSATNSCGSSNYSQWTSITLSSDSCTSAPGVPSGLSGNSQNISWNASAGATNYDVQYWTGSWTAHGSTASTSYSLGLSGTQYVRVRASNSCGASSYSSWIRVN